MPSSTGYFTLPVMGSGDAEPASSLSTLTPLMGVPSNLQVSEPHKHEPLGPLCGTPASLTRPRGVLQAMNLPSHHLPCLTKGSLALRGAQDPHLGVIPNSFFLYLHPICFRHPHGAHFLKGGKMLS